MNVENLCETNNLSLLIKIIERNPNTKLTKECFECAVKNNNFEMVSFLRNQNPSCPWNEACCIIACENNNDMRNIEIFVREYFL